MTNLRLQGERTGRHDGMSDRLELTWPNKDKFLLVPKNASGKPVWVEPADWIETAYAFENAVAGGFFVCARPAAGSLDTIRAARVVVDACENPTDWDLVVRDGLASVDLSGELQWC